LYGDDYISGLLCVSYIATDYSLSSSHIYLICSSLLSLLGFPFTFQFTLYSPFTYLSLPTTLYYFHSSTFSVIKS